MKYNIFINQVAMIENNLNVTQFAILDIISVAPTWTNPISVDNEIYFFIARQKIAEELRAFNLKPDTIYRHVKELAKLGFLDYVKSGKKDCIRLSKKSKELFSSAMSEINPSYYVGNKSENYSEINPTYNNTPSNNTTSISYMSEVEEILTHLNMVSKKKFNLKNKSATKLITTRLNEGYEINDFIKVNLNKSAEWLSSEKMNSFLRPETLYGSKFDTYLNQTISENQKIGMIQEHTGLTPLEQLRQKGQA